MSAIGVSFILMNIGLFWGGLPMPVFSNGVAAAAPKDFPALISSANLLGESSNLRFTVRELMIAVITVPLMIGLTSFVRYTKTGKAMRAVAQNGRGAAHGVDINRVIGATFLIGGALGGAASVIYALYNNTIRFDLATAPAWTPSPRRRSAASARCRGDAGRPP